MAAARFMTRINALILIPLFHGFLEFIGGLIGALIYNFVAGIVGGIRIDQRGDFSNALQTFPVNREFVRATASQRDRPVRSDRC